MTPITPATRLALTLGTASALCGTLLYVGWFGANLLHDIKDEVAGLRSDIRLAATDRWTGRDMRDYVIEVRELNGQVVRTDGKRGLILPDIIRIQSNNNRRMTP